MVFVRLFDQIDNIPDELIQLCLSFYLILFDKWNANHKPNVTINEGDNSVTVTTSSIAEVVGNLWIEKGQVQEWRINVKSTGKFYAKWVYKITTI